MKKMLGAILAAVVVMSGSAFAQTVMLTDLDPAGVEWGTEPHPFFPDMKSGPFICDFGSWGAQQASWSNNRKIVKSIPEGLEFEDGQVYKSSMENVFAVEGEFVTGVGLLARRMSFYYWIEYEVPEGATKFTADIFVTDDVSGYDWRQMPMNQQFEWSIILDDVVVHTGGRTRLALSQGSGELLNEVNLAIPAGAKKIRFLLKNSSWGDTNGNTELVISSGKFVF